MKEMRYKRWLRGAVSMALALVLAFAQVTPAAAVTQAQINSLKKNASSLTSQKKALKAKLDALSNDKANAMERKELLDQQIATTTAQIQNTEAQINKYAELITQSEEELEDAQQREQEQYDLFCARVRDMEERGNISYWSVLFKASSFSDLLGRLDIVNEIMDSDQKVIDELQALQAEIEEKKAELEDSKQESEAAKADLVSKKSELNQQRTEATQVIQQLADSQNATEAQIDGLEDEEASIQAQIQKLSKQLAAEEEARRKAAAAAAAAAAAQGKSSSGSTTTTSSAALGGYIWPVGSRRITSTFGGRASPGGIGSTNHKGVDIGGVGYSTAIKAAKAGTVIISEYSRSYGNYVVVSHGSGNTTLYAHMSSRKVSKGQTVKQGDTLGITGSTGNSTGPHLHFEITENGVRINPLKYLTGYTLAK